MAQPFTDLPIPPELALEAEPLSDADLRSIEIAGHSEMAEALSEPAARFVVDDDGKAEWCMRHVAALTREEAQLKAQADDWSRRIFEWFSSSVRDVVIRRAFFEDHLIRYQRQRREANPKAATLKLPSGKVTSTRSEPCADVQNEAELIAWLREYVPAPALEAAEAVKVVESVLLTGLRRLVTVAERTRPPDDEDGEPIVERFVVPIVNPETGEPWPAEQDLVDLAVPGAMVRPAGLSIKVKPDA